MSIFNSLGSNYDFKYVYKSLFTLGGNSNNLEKFLEEKYGGKANLLYKGREAIELAFKVLNLPPGNFVAINGFTCFAVYQAIKNAKFNVEYLDINRGELNFSANTLEEAIKKNKKIKAVIIQNTLGYPCQIEKISKICQENKITLIEDLAHCVGTIYSDGREAGIIGDMTILSFSQDKMIDGISGGALIIRNNKSFQEELNNLPLTQQIIDKLYPLFTYLIRKTYSIDFGKLLHFILKKLNLLSKPMNGANSLGPHKLSNWYSNLISEQFDNLENNLSHRRKIAFTYANNINPKILSKTIISQIPHSTNLRFPIFVEDRGVLIKFLERYQIFVSDIWYDAVIAPKKYLRETDYHNQCPNSELASSQILNLPTHLNTSEEDARKISGLVNQWLKS